MKANRRHLIAILTTSAILAPVVIVPPVLMSTTMQNDPNQKWFDQSGYQDPTTGFTISAYGNLLQKLGFQATMNFANVTNKQFAKQLKIHNLEQFFTINVISGAVSANEIKLEIKNLKTKTNTIVIVKNLTWSPFDHPSYNSIEIIGQFQWNVEKWMQLKLPLSFSATTYFNPDPLLKLSDAQIKDLLIGFNFESQKQMLNFNNSFDNFFYQYPNNYDDPNRDLFQFKFIQNHDQSISLDVQLKDPNRNSLNHKYDPESDQWLTTNLEPLVMHTIASEWQGYQENGLAISAIGDPIQAQNLPLKQLFKDQIKVKQPNVKLNFSASELTYQLDHQFDFAHQNKQLKSLVSYNESLLKPYLDSNVPIKYLWTLKTSEWSDQFEPDHYLTINDEKDASDQWLQTYYLVPRIQIGDRFFQFKAQSDQWDQLPKFTSNNFFTKDIINKLPNQLIFKDSSEIAKILTRKLKNDQHLNQLVQQWVANPADPQIKQAIINQSQQLLTIDDTNLLDFKLESWFDWKQLQATFNFKQFFPFEVVDNYQYWQQSGQYNLQNRVYTTLIDQQMHNFHFRNWNWNLKTNGNNLIPIKWDFDDKEKLITIGFASNFSWQPEPASQPTSTLIIDANLWVVQKGF